MTILLPFSNELFRFLNAVSFLKKTVLIFEIEVSELRNFHFYKTSRFNVDGACFWTSEITKTLDFSIFFTFGQVWSSSKYQTEKKTNGVGK